MSQYQAVRQSLLAHPKRWLVTGAAGFIGSNLVEALLNLGQDVVGVDNFSTGFRRNLEGFQDGARYPGRFDFLEGTICDLDLCRSACKEVDYVLHQAALGSVPRSLADPIATNDANVTGFLNVLVAARDSRVTRFVYAGSSSTYGDHPALPKVEEAIGRPLSPYAVTKYVNELYGGIFQRAYGIEVVGLRYFNVFGRRQDPEGAYAAVIPRWVGRLLTGKPCEIYGDGETSRDFCYIENVVQANLLAALSPSSATGEVYNIAFGERTTLASLFTKLRDGLAGVRPELAGAQPIFKPFQAGDVRHSLADTSKAKRMLGYSPTHNVEQGLSETLRWYIESFSRSVSDNLVVEPL